MTKYVCVLCTEQIGDYDAWQPMNAQQYAHNECGLREVVGGIGHQIAHEYWCTIKRDPDAGLTYRQSALLVWKMVELLGVDEISRRAASVPAAAEPEPEPEPPGWVLGMDPASDDDEDWAVVVVKWAESEVPPEEPPPPRP